MLPVALDVQRHIRSDHLVMNHDPADHPTRSGVRGGVRGGVRLVACLVACVVA